MGSREVLFSFCFLSFFFLALSLFCLHGHALSHPHPLRHLEPLLRGGVREGGLALILDDRELAPSAPLLGLLPTAQDVDHF